MKRYRWYNYQINQNWILRKLKIFDLFQNVSPTKPKEIIPIISILNLTKTKWTLTRTIYRWVLGQLIQWVYSWSRVRQNILSSTTCSIGCSIANKCSEMLNEWNGFWRPVKWFGAIYRPDSSNHKFALTFNLTLTRGLTPLEIFPSSLKVFKYSL